jgi:putative endonuclease
MSPRSRRSRPKRSPGGGRPTGGRRARSPAATRRPFEQGDHCSQCFRSGDRDAPGQCGALAVAGSHYEAGQAGLRRCVGNRGPRPAAAQFAAEAELGAEADALEPRLVELPTGGEHAAGDGEVKLSAAATRRRSDVDRGAAPGKAVAAVEHRRLHALPQITRRASAETDDGQPRKPGAQIQLDVHVHCCAAVYGEGVCTHEHSHMSPGAGVATDRATAPSPSCRTFVALLHQAGGAVVLWSRGMPTNRQVLGNAGERLALQHYERLGFELLARNHRTRAGELDLIVADRRALVFVEVKTRRSGGLDPLVSITPQKRRRIRRLGAAWLADHPEHPRRNEVRFDAVAVVLDAAGNLVALEQLESIA